ncbi:hypothetical protein FC47_GL001584 [Limosilactobacillus mucosae DSM 13345]|uniref:Uncharacterized protein n=2 Tax=Limosilactobacillus mucosae TaxID=97478 RepID=A0A0R1NQV7_LIMMU|nr:hypothetical protein FC47_GL001584 [Limosilactobacillus mucosae DSM 13345]
MVILQLFKTMEECLDMKKILVSFLVVLVGLSLTACGSNNKQAKENSSLKAQNSSLKAKEQQRENSSLKAENSSLKNDKQTSTASSNNTSNQEDNTSNQEDPARLSNEEVGNRVKTAKGDTSPDYNTIVENHGDGTYDVELRRDAPSGQNSNLIGEYVYNAKTNAITTKFESGLD